MDCQPKENNAGYNNLFAKVAYCGININIVKIITIYGT